ncbi:uncharacterized protein LOC127836300 [Dreissena polymorpha]|uniref:uncharacterized protein LOC127836300 n=1 Tax=Dreissena polymorpha TaxID=45954 RepID=UPI002263C6D1|nr:uncharacterized protein LOC127836300 [Dreissena polymorpha]XP_052218771.1 uncharacterized protein LOC127836300 [Dreissena polymorpha]XP_052218772.1 uncharacterized protein LOC127836300 [Dreissena polymorpha]
MQQKEGTVVMKLMTELMGTPLSNTVTTQHLQSFENTDDFVGLHTSNCYSRPTIDVGDKHNLRQKKKSITNTTYHEVVIPTISTELVCGYHTRKKKKATTDITCEVVPIPDQKADRKQFVYHGATDHVLQPRDLYWCVMPVTQEVFVQELRRIVEKTVQGEPVPAQESMRFELLRSCTYRTFPKDGKPDVRKLAEAGFYYASNNDEVICYCCYKRISNWNADDDPLAVHRRISPTCRFFTDAATVNVTKEVTAHVESEIMAKIQGGRRRNTPRSAPLPTKKESQSPGNVADSGVSLCQRPPAQAHGQFVLAQSGDTSLPIYQPTDRTRELAKYQSMMPQTTRMKISQTGHNFRLALLCLRTTLGFLLSTLKLCNHLRTNLNKE